MQESGNIDYFSITASQINLLYHMTPVVHRTLLNHVVYKQSCSTTQVKTETLNRRKETLWDCEVSVSWNEDKIRSGAMKTSASVRRNPATSCVVVQMENILGTFVKSGGERCQVRHSALWFMCAVDYSKTSLLPKSFPCMFRQLL